MFPIDRRLIPPTIEHAHSSLQHHVDPEALRRRTLFANALAGDEQAKTTLRTTYHLTCWISNGREILNESHTSDRRTRTLKIVSKTRRHHAR